MKKLGKALCVVGVIAIALCFVFLNCIRNEHFMTYNVRNGSGMDGVKDFARTAAVINREKPDVVAIQELDSVTGRSKGAYVLGELAKLTGMHAYVCTGY